EDGRVAPYLRTGPEPADVGEQPHVDVHHGARSHAGTTQIWVPCVVKRSPAMARAVWWSTTHAPGAADRVWSHPSTGGRCGNQQYRFSHGIAREGACTGR